MSDPARPAIRDLIAQLARIEDLRRTPHGAEQMSGGLSHVELAAAEQDIIDELRHPGRSLQLPGLAGPAAPSAAAG